jgi:hypothetical protein
VFHPRDLTLVASRRKADESKGRIVVKRLISAIVLALACLATAAAPANADPVMHFGVFTINCPNHVEYVIVSKPGSSNVVTVNGVASNSVSILMGFTVVDKATGAVLDEFHKPYALKQGDRILICEDRGFPDIIVIAEVKFTPGH